jgi:hypothetical protein
MNGKEILNRILTKENRKAILQGGILAREVYL